MLCDSLEVWEEGSRGRGHMYTLRDDSRYCMIEINTTLENNYPTIKNKFKRKRKKEKVHEEILKGGGYFYYLDCGDGFMGVCTFLICVAFYISIIPNKAI